MVNNAFGQETAANRNVAATVYFIPGTMKIEYDAGENPFKKLSTSKEYVIEGYACNEDQGGEEEIIAAADQRARIVKDRLVKEGHSSIKLTTIAYDKSVDCKVTVIEKSK